MILSTIRAERNSSVNGKLTDNLPCPGTIITKKNLKEKFVNHLFSQFVEKVKKLIRFSLCQNEKKEPGAVLAASGVETLITRRFTLHPNEF